jgi:DNA-binding response OmpR family regulator
MSAVVYVMEDGLLRWEATEVCLTQKEAQLFGLLAKRRPHLIAMERLAAFYSGGGNDPKSNVRVAVNGLRKKLRPVPLTVKNRPGWGYWLSGELTVE